MIAISSFSLRSQLGPLRLGYLDQAGVRREFVMPYPEVIGVGEFARECHTRFNVDAIELCQIQFAALGHQGAQGFREELDNAGVSVRTVPIDIGDIGSADDARREHDMNEIITWFEIAGLLGARFVRVNAGSPVGPPPALDLVATSLRTLARAAGDLGLRLLVENHGGRSSDPDFLLDLRESVGPEQLGLLLDLGNLEPLVSAQHTRLTGGEEAEHLDLAPLYTAIARLAPHADLVHAKSYGSQAGGAAALFDPVRALRAARDAGYTGPISVEYEGEGGDPWVETGKVVELIHEVFSVAR